MFSIFGKPCYYILKNRISNSVFFVTISSLLLNFIPTKGYCAGVFSSTARGDDVSVDLTPVYSQLTDLNSSIKK